METPPTREFPGPLDGIQLGAIGRQKVQGELGSLLVAPLPMEFGAMLLSVVADGQNAVARNGAGFLKHFQKLPEGLPVEPARFPAEEKLAIS